MRNNILRKHNVFDSISIKQNRTIKNIMNNDLTFSPLTEQINQLSALLVRRGLRFPVKQNLLIQLFGTRFIAIGTFVTSFLSDVVIWLIILRFVEIDLLVAFVSALIISFFQISGTTILTVVLWMSAKLVRRIKVSTSFRSIRYSRLRQVFIRYLSISLSILVPISLDLLAMWAGISFTSSQLNQDIQSALAAKFFNININFNNINWEALVPILPSAILILLLIRLIDQLPRPKWLISLAKNGLSSYLLIIFVHTGIPLFISVLLHEQYPLASLLLLIHSVHTVLSKPLMLSTLIVGSGITTVVISLPSLIRLRANILGLTFLAAAIPFLNADSWQLVSKLNGPNLIAVLGLLYIIPTLLLIYAQRELLVRQWNASWQTNDFVSENELLSICHEFSLIVESSLEEYIRNQYSSSQKSVAADELVVRTKYCLRWILLLITLPTMVFLFALILFYTLINNELLSAWTTGFYSPEPLNLFIICIDGWAILKIKSAILLAILSTTSTLGTLFTSKDELIEFIQQGLAHDVQQDKKLLMLYRILISN